MTSNNKTTELDSKRACEQCKRSRRLCDSQHPCSQCIETSQNCVYGVHDYSRNIFYNLPSKKLSSGLACETYRRRTKCNDESPCGFCTANGFECIHSLDKKNHKKPIETMDRIEDRLRRIERLMTAFTPSLLHQIEGHRAKPHRYSVQGVNSARERKELLDKRGLPKIDTLLTSLSMRSQTSKAHSMLDLTLSPSSSVCISVTPSSTPLDSTSTNDYKNEYFKDHLPTPPPSRSETECKLSIPSVTDQLSEHTFVVASTDHTSTQYPIYPLTSNHLKHS